MEFAAEAVVAGVAGGIDDDDVAGQREIQRAQSTSGILQQRTRDIARRSEQHGGLLQVRAAQILIVDQAGAISSVDQLANSLIQFPPAALGGRQLGKSGDNERQAVGLPAHRLRKGKARTQFAM